MSATSPIPSRPPRAVRSRRRIVIAGAGIGGLEAALALRAHLGPTVGLDLVDPQDSFTYRPLTVAEPFGYERALRFPLAELERSHGIVHVRGALQAVHAPTHEVTLDDGEQLHYDALVVATGARPEAWLPGSLCFAGARATDGMRALLAEVEAGGVQDLCFVAPPGAWTLPVYELALLTAGWCADRGVIGARLTVVTAETTPLAAFGAAAARTVLDLLGDRGVQWVNGDATALTTGRLALRSGATLAADAVVSVPVLRHTPALGLPADASGFIPVDEHAAVRGLRDVYAVGDVTDQPLKQGGLAAQQADAAASAIAHALGAPVRPEPFRPVLRGLLLSGVGAAFLRRAADGGSEASFGALWWPPTKVAGRHLGPFLADRRVPDQGRTLTDRPAAEDTEAARRDRQELRRIALELAQSEAEWGDVRTALRWLRTLEWLDGTASPEIRELRERWSAQR